MEQVPRNLGEMGPVWGHIPGSGQCGLGEMGVPDLGSYPPTRRLSWHRGREPLTHTAGGSWQRQKQPLVTLGSPSCLQILGFFFFPLVFLSF